MSVAGLLTEVSRKRKALLILAALLLGAAPALPLWGMTLVSTQYPEGLRLVVYPARIAGDVNEINALNHYIGMTPISDRLLRRAAVPPAGPVCCWPRDSWSHRRRYLASSRWSIPVALASMAGARRRQASA